MGANTDGSTMPSQLFKAFVGAFSRLKKYRIFWRIGTNLELKDVDLESLPVHINVTTYIPQNDLLGECLPDTVDARYKTRPRDRPKVSLITGLIL